MSQRDKVLLILRDAGGFGATADHITQTTGCRRVAARVDELRKDGHKITGSFVDRAKGVYKYVLVAEVGASTPPAPEAFADSLFSANTQKPLNAIYGDEAA